MVEVTIAGDRVHFEVEGWDKLWAFKSRLDIPLSHVTGVRVDPEAARGWWFGLRMPGTQLPGVITAGTFYQHGGRAFFDVHDPDRSIIIDLDHETYTHLVIEVEDPPRVLAQLQAAIAARA